MSEILPILRENDCRSILNDFVDQVNDVGEVENYNQFRAILDNNDIGMATSSLISHIGRVSEIDTNNYSFQSKQNGWVLKAINTFSENYSASYIEQSRRNFKIGPRHLNILLLHSPLLHFSTAIQETPKRREVYILSEFSNDYLIDLIESENKTLYTDENNSTLSSKSSMYLDMKKANTLDNLNGFLKVGSQLISALINAS